jgi:AraC-like DNA-binding protein
MYVFAMDFHLPSVQYGFLTHDFPVHDHTQWEIHLVTGGRGALVQQGRRWEVSAGSVSLTPPRHGHELEVDGSLSFFYLQFEGDREVSSVLKRLLDRQELEGPLRAEPAQVAEAARLKEKLDSSVADRVASGVHGFRAWLYDLAAGTTETVADGVDRALVWLGQNLGTRLELDGLAAVAGLDRFAFSRRFKTRTGLPPLAYVHRSKVEAASFLLAGTDLALAEVALRLGFCDEFHFGKVFKKWRGVSPGRWRRERRGSTPSGVPWP